MNLGNEAIGAERAEILNKVLRTSGELKYIHGSNKAKTLSKKLDALVAVLAHPS